MTIDEYRAKTGIKTAGQAAAYLLWLRLAFFAYVLGAVAMGASIYFAWPGVWRLLALSIVIASVLSLTYLAITILYLVGEKLRSVLFMVIVPLAWFWGYFKLAAPLKIIIGSQPAPEQTPARFLNARVDPWAPYLAFAGNRFLLALIMVGAIVGVGFLSQGGATNQPDLIYRFSPPDNKFSISFPSAPTSHAGANSAVTFYSSRGADGEQFMVAAVDSPAVNKNGAAIDDQTAYDAMFQGVVQASAGTIDSKDNITTPYGTGVHFVGRMATPTGVNMEGEMIRSNGRVYVMTVLAKDGDPADRPATAFDFFQSFVLNQ